MLSDVFQHDFHAFLAPTIRRSLPERTIGPDQSQARRAPTAVPRLRAEWR